MTAQGVGHVCRIDGHMDAGTYTGILDSELMQTLEYYGLDKRRIMFQQDNDPKHTSKPARQWFATNQVEVLKWLP